MPIFYCIYFLARQCKHTIVCLKTLVIDNSGCVDQRDLPVSFDSKCIIQFRNAIHLTIPMMS